MTATFQNLGFEAAGVAPGLAAARTLSEARRVAVVHQPGGHGHAGGPTGWVRPHQPRLWRRPRAYHLFALIL